MLCYDDVLRFAYSMDKEKFSGFVTSVAFTVEGNNLYTESDK